MKVLLDTHILIWALIDDPKLFRHARQVILDVNNEIYYSVVSIWEVAIKHAAHPDNVTFSGREFTQYCEAAGYISLKLCNEHVYAVERLTRFEGAARHSDPFDRILIAQAKTEGMLFLTHDNLLSGYDEDCIVIV